MVAAETFKALGDPVRLEMIQRLANGSPHNIGSLTEGLGVTRQGARKHLQVLSDVRLVRMQTSGRQVEVSLDHRSLLAAKLFITELEQRWDRRLEALRDFVEKDDSNHA